MDSLTVTLFQIYSTKLEQYIFPLKLFMLQKLERLFLGTDYTITDHAKFRGFKSDTPKDWMVGLPKEETNATSQTGVEQEVHLTPTP